MSKTQSAREAFPLDILDRARRSSGGPGAKLRLDEASDSVDVKVIDVALFTRDTVALTRAVIEPLFTFWADAARADGMTEEEIAEQWDTATTPLTLVAIMGECLGAEIAHRQAGDISQGAQP